MRPGRIISVLALLLATQSCAVSKYAGNLSHPMVKDSYKPEGSLEEVFLNSSEPGMTRRRAYVYLPVGYHDNDDRYPVLYLLHGARCNECVWIDKGALESFYEVDGTVESG